MLDLRLLVLVGLFSQAFALRTLTPDQINEEAKTKNLLVGYLGNDKVPNCRFMQDFKSQVEQAAFRLRDDNITVVLTNGSYEDGNRGSPIVVFYQYAYDPVPYILDTNGDKISNLVKKMLRIDSAFHLISEADYNLFKFRHKTLFVAYLNSSDEIDLYNMVAREFNVPFLYTRSEKFAKEVLKSPNESIFAEHGWIGERGRVWLPLEEFRQTYDTSYIREFALNEIRHQTTEISSYDDAIRAFSTDAENIAIVFAPTNNLSTEARLLTGASAHLIAANKLVAYYAASDVTDNKKFMEELKVDTDKAIVLVLKQNELSENPFTKRCFEKSHIKLDDRQIFRGDNMTKLYEHAIGLWISKKH